MGHIIQRICMIDKKAQQLRLEKKRSDYGVDIVCCRIIYFAEYGSPKMPTDCRGGSVVLLDVMDARMFQMEEALYLWCKTANLPKEFMPWKIDRSINSVRKNDDIELISMDISFLILSCN